MSGGRSDFLMVRSEELAPIIEEWLERYEAEKGILPTAFGKRVPVHTSRNGSGSYTSTRGYKVEPKVEPLGGTAFLSYHAKVSTRLIWSVRNKERQHVTLTTADRILTTIDQTHAFHDGRVTVIPNPWLSNETYLRKLAEEGRVCDPDPV